MAGGLNWADGRVFCAGDANLDITLGVKNAKNIMVGRQSLENVAKLVWQESRDFQSVCYFWFAIAKLGNPAKPGGFGAWGVKVHVVNKWLEHFQCFLFVVFLAGALPSKKRHSNFIWPTPKN